MWRDSPFFLFVKQYWNERIKNKTKQIKTKTTIGEEYKPGGTNYGVAINSTFSAPDR